MKRTIRLAVVLLFIAPLFVSFGFVAPKTTPTNSYIYEYAFAYDPQPLGNNYYNVVIWFLQVNMAPDQLSYPPCPGPINIDVNVAGTPMGFTFPQDSSCIHVGVMYSATPPVNGYWMSTSPSAIGNYRIYDTLTNINNDFVY